MTIMKLNSRAKTLVDSQKASLDDLLTVVAYTTENGGVHVNKPYDFLKKWEKGDKDTDVKNTTMLAAVLADAIKRAAVCDGAPMSLELIDDTDKLVLTVGEWVFLFGFNNTGCFPSLVMEMPKSIPTITDSRATSSGLEVMFKPLFTWVEDNPKRFGLMLRFSQVISIINKYASSYKAVCMSEIYYELSRLHGGDTIDDVPQAVRFVLREEEGWSWFHTESRIHQNMYAYHEPFTIRQEIWVSHNCTDKKLVIKSEAYAIDPTSCPMRLLSVDVLDGATGKPVENLHCAHGNVSALDAVKIIAQWAEENLPPIKQ